MWDSLTVVTWVLLSQWRHSVVRRLQKRSNSHFAPWRRTRKSTRTRTDTHRKHALTVKGKRSRHVWPALLPFTYTSEACEECTLAPLECQARLLRRKWSKGGWGCVYGRGGYHSDTCWAEFKWFSCSDSGDGASLSWLAGRLSAAAATTVDLSHTEGLFVCMPVHA